MDMTTQPELTGIYKRGNWVMTNDKPVDFIFSMNGSEPHLDVDKRVKLVMIAEHKDLLPW
jgi:hypothetical protein